MTPRGSKWWRFKYRFGGKEKGLSFGVYPEVSLKQAREKRDQARRLVANSVDPSSQRKALKVAQADTFAAIAAEWLELKRKKLAPVTFAKAAWVFEKLLNPYIGNRRISELAAPDILAVLRRIEERGKHETAHRAKQHAGQVFRYAVATGRAERDPTADLRGALAPVVVKNHAAIVEPVRVGELLRAIDSYPGQLATAAALKLAPLLFVRPGELRRAEWMEFELDAKEPQWRIPAERMKMREQHLVPLSRQDLIELQLAHAERNKVRAAYNRAERIAERRKMMQAWADYLDGLRIGGKVVPIPRKKSAT